MAAINFDAVHAFAVFAESMNFSAAALRLHISQPALHVKIRKLGEQLNCPLYRREGRALILTVQGEKVALFARQMRDAGDTFLADLSGLSLSRPVVLAAGEGAYLYLLEEGIRTFQRAPDAALHLMSLNGADTLRAVLAGQAQLGVAPLDTVPDGIQATRLTSVEQVLAVPADHRLAKRSRVKLQDLSGERLVVPPVDRPHRQMLSALLQSAQIPWEIAVEASGWELMLSLVAMRSGVAVVNACCRLPKGLVAIPISELPSVHYACFHLRGADQHAHVARLKKCLLAHSNDWKARR
jgi:LysR family transcriptional regulator, low CO2-responsive transcriptional regulator